MENNNVKVKKMKRPVKIALIAAIIIVLLATAVYAMVSGSIVFAGINKDRAKEIALTQVPGAKEANVTKCWKDYDDGISTYDVEIVYDGYEYDFEITADDGRIINSDKDVHYTQGSNLAKNDAGSGNNSTDYKARNDTSNASCIGIEKAKSIALQQVSGATSANIVDAHCEYDDGREEYNVTIHYNGHEYDFELDASTGNILSRDTDTIDDHYDD